MFKISYGGKHEKEPIYLWVLLVLSALISSMSLFGILESIAKDVFQVSLMNSGTLTLVIRRQHQPYYKHQNPLTLFLICC